MTAPKTIPVIEHADRMRLALELIASLRVKDTDDSRLLLVVNVAKAGLEQDGDPMCEVLR